MKIQQACFTQLPSAEGLGPLAALMPQLVFVFGSVAALSRPDLVPTLCAAFPNAELAGCTTAGEISDDGVTDEQLVVTAVQFDHPGLRVACTDIDGMGDSAAAGARLAQQLIAPGLHDVFVLCQGVNVNGSALIEGFEGVLPSDVTLSGGLAGDGGSFSRTFTLSRHGVSDRQIVAIGFTDPHLKFRHASFHGWQPFGPARKVTRSQGNVLYELDGAPALEVYKKYLGEYAKDLPGSGLLFPFEMLGQDHHAVGLIRTILGVDEAQGSLTLAGDIVENGYLKLMHATTDSLVDGAYEAAHAIGLDAEDQSRTGLALLVSCVGRKLVMGARVDDEVEAVAEVFGRHTHVAGFYSNGEISPALSGGVHCHLHNQTMTVTHLCEGAGI